jgi:hypothetical protein
MAPEVGEKLSLFFGFDTLCDYRQSHRLAERDNGLGNGLTAGIDK